MSSLLPVPRPCTLRRAVSRCCCSSLFTTLIPLRSVCPSLRQVYAKMQASEFVTIYNTTALEIQDQSKSLNYCIDAINQLGWKNPSEASWIIDIDIDEVFAFGDFVADKDCTGSDKTKGCGPSNPITAMATHAFPPPILLLMSRVPPPHTHTHTHTHIDTHTHTHSLCP